MNASTTAAPGAWRRTSPLSFVVGAIVALPQVGFAALAAVFASDGLEGGAWLVLILLGIVALSLGISYLKWRNLRYRLGETDISVEHGLLARTARSVPYERIQDVSLEQALVPRLFGMVQVKFETGAGGKDELKLAYVTEHQGAQLRETVRARLRDEAAVEVASEGPVAEPTRRLFTMSPRRLLTFGVFEFSLIVFAVIGGAAQQLDFLLPFDLWDPDEWHDRLAGPAGWLLSLGLAAQAIGAIFALVGVGLVGLVTGIVRTVLRDYGFRLDDTPKGLRRRRGLLTRTDVTMPLHRIQALRLTTGILRRRFGWHGLEAISLASDAKSSNHTVVPFGMMEDIAPVADLTDFPLPASDAAWQFTSARPRLDRALIDAAVPLLAALAVVSLVPAVERELAVSLLLPGLGLVLLAAVLALRQAFLWRHDRHALNARHIYVRRGWLAPKLSIASRTKLQSVEIVQGPLARRRGYAAIRFGLAGGKLDIAGIPVAEARAITAAVLGSIARVDFSDLREASDG